MTNETEARGLSAAEFHARPGVADWRGTAWGPQAVFRATSLGHAARLLDAIVAEAERFAVAPDVDLRPEAIIVRVPYRGADRIPLGAAEFAAAVSAAASDLDLQADPALISAVDIAVAQAPGVDTRPFWTAALGYDIVGVYDSIDPLRRGPQLSFQPIRADRTARGRTHIDVSVPSDFAEERVARALAAGGRLVDDSRAPAWWTIASPDNHGIDIAAWTDTYE
jgi:4a-hydroxytetrahydrobiopterin dehydratase